MLTVNRATLLGHAGRAPEIRSLANGNKAASFSLATTERWKDRNGETVESTEWHRITVYGPAVGIVERMLKKGDAVLVEGRLATRRYTGSDGVERSVNEIVAAGPQGMVSVLAKRRPEDGDGGSGA